MFKSGSGLLVGDYNEGMGVGLCNANLPEEGDNMELNPLLSSFAPISQQIQMRNSHEKLFEKISSPGVR